MRPKKKRKSSRSISSLPFSKNVNESHLNTEGEVGECSRERRVWNSENKDAGNHKVFLATHPVTTDVTGTRHKDAVSAAAGKRG